MPCPATEWLMMRWNGVEGQCKGRAKIRVAVPGNATEWHRVRCKAKELPSKDKQRKGDEKKSISMQRHCIAA